MFEIKKKIIIYSNVKINMNATCKTLIRFKILPLPSNLQQYIKMCSTLIIFKYSE